MTRIVIHLDDNQGRASVLTEVRPAQESPTESRTKLMDIFDSRDRKLILRNQGYLMFEKPFAVTFTFPPIFKRLFRGKWRETNFLETSGNDQVEIFQEMFDRWLPLVKRRLYAVQNTRSVACYEIYGEYTQQGILHAHGLIYITAPYPNAVRHILMKAWSDVCHGASMIAMKKKNCRGGYNYAMDLCNDVKAWRKYITKEHLQFADNPVVLEDDVDCPMEVGDED